MNDAVIVDPALLEVRDLTVRYAGTAAVRDVSFRLQPGEALGIVGESGSGKSSIAGAILDFLGPAASISGQILFEGRDLTRLSRSDHRAVLGRKIGSVFQDPFTALNPALRVGRQIAEPIVRHLRAKPTEAMQRAVALLREMGIQRADSVAEAFPHQLSGGMKQRALIAAALACEPPLLILDEPTTALDVTVEAQILRLLARLRQLMEEEKVYRQEGFGVAALVAALNVPEYRLRRLINQRLGHRNFSSFVNGYRLAEVTAALADPAQADVPILTIALDAGFQSIGPFNRAFKAHTGMTPTAYRKQADSRTQGPVQGIGQPAAEIGKT